MSTENGRMWFSGKEKRVKIDWKRKLTSRKFWMSLGTFAGMMIVACGGTENQATQIVSLIMAGAAVVAYVIGEGMADAAGIAKEGDS